MTQESKRPWYEDAFGEDYVARYKHRDEEEAALAAGLLAREASASADSVCFDLCCGAGRHLRAMRQLGLESFGGDLSMALLRHGRRGGAGVVRLDMRELPLRSESVHVLSNFFTAFGYFESDSENFRVFREVSRVLTPGGTFLFDFLNSFLVTADLEPVGGSSVVVEHDEEGLRWEVTRRLTSAGRVEKVRKCMDDSGRRSVTESVRLFNCEELVDGLEQAGLRPREFFGGYQGEAFSLRQSQRLVILSEKPRRA